MNRFAIYALLCLTAPVYAQGTGSAPQSPVDGFMMQFDGNQDGQVSLDEFKEPQVSAIEQQFTYMDKNRDGQIDRAEIEAFSQEMQQRMQQMQQQGGQPR